MMAGMVASEAVVLMLLHWPVMGLLFLLGATAYSWVSIRLALGYVSAADFDRWVRPEAMIGPGR